jgi:hypothetical protein
MLITGRIPDKGHSDCIMTFLRFAPALCILMIAASRPGLAEPSLDPPNWSAAAARQAVAQSDTAAALRPLLALARTQQHDVLLKELRMLSANDDLALPARERILFEFATSLGALEPHEIDPGVLSWLMSYEPRVLVPHEDAGLSGVPMYKVRAAAAGVAYNRQRQSAGRRAARPEDQGNAAWLAAYVDSTPAIRQGYLDAIEGMPEKSLRDLAMAAAEALPHRRELTPVAALAAERLVDVELFQAVVTEGRGPSVAVALRSAVQTLDEVELSGLLQSALSGAPAVNASLALAEIAPFLFHQHETVSLLLGLLDDPELGASAALTLSRSPDPVVREHLARLAGSDLGLASKRAALATGLAAEAIRGSDGR